MAKAAFFSISYESPVNRSVMRVVNQIDYMAAKSGADRSDVDVTLTQRDIDCMMTREIIDYNEFVGYIAERPGVVPGTETPHGLWCANGPADIDSTVEQINSLEHAYTYHGIFTLERETAMEIGVDTKQDWQQHLDNLIEDTAKTLDIPIEDVEWRASFHDDLDKNPHIHFIFWDKQDRLPVRDGSAGSSGHIPQDKLEDLKARWTKEFYGPYRENIYASKDHARDSAVEAMKGLAGARRPSEVAHLINGKDLEPIIGQMNGLAYAMPGQGRVAFAAKNKYIRARADSVVDALIKHPLLKDHVDKFVGDSVELARHHGEDIGLVLGDNIRRTAEEVASNSLLAGAADEDVDFFIHALQASKVSQNRGCELVRAATAGKLSEDAVMGRWKAAEAVRETDKPVRMSRDSAWWSWRAKFDLGEVIPPKGQLEKSAENAMEDLRGRLRNAVLHCANDRQPYVMIEAIVRKAPLIRKDQSLAARSIDDKIKFARFLKMANMNEHEAVKLLSEASGESLSYVEAREVVDKVWAQGATLNFNAWRMWDMKDSILREISSVEQGATLSKGSDIELYVRGLKEVGYSTEDIAHSVALGLGYDLDNTELVDLNLSELSFDQLKAYGDGIENEKSLLPREWARFKSANNVVKHADDIKVAQVLSGTREEMRELYTRALATTTLSDEKIVEQVQAACRGDESEETTKQRLGNIREEYRDRAGSIAYKEIKELESVASKPAVRERIEVYIGEGRASSFAQYPEQTQARLIHTMRYANFSKEETIELLAGCQPKQHQESTISNIDKFWNKDFTDKSQWADYIASESICSTKLVIESSSSLTGGTAPHLKAYTQSLQFAGFNQAEATYSLARGMGNDSPKTPHSDFVGTTYQSSARDFKLDRWWEFHTTDSIKRTWESPLRSKTLLSQQSSDLDKYFGALTRIGIDPDRFLRAAKEHDPQGNYMHAYNTFIRRADKACTRRDWSEFRVHNAIIRTAPAMMAGRMLEGASEGERMVYTRALLSAGIGTQEAAQTVSIACGGDEAFATTVQRFASTDANITFEPSEWHHFISDKGDIFQNDYSPSPIMSVADCAGLLRSAAQMLGASEAQSNAAQMQLIFEKSRVARKPISSDAELLERSTSLDRGTEQRQSL